MVSDNSNKRCISIKYSKSDKYKKVYVKCPTVLSSNTWSFLISYNKNSPGYLTYAYYNSLKNNSVELRENLTRDDLIDCIKIPRTKTTYNIENLF
jgi:hypothetical protein